MTFVPEIEISLWNNCRYLYSSCLDSQKLSANSFVTTASSITALTASVLPANKNANNSSVSYEEP